MMMNTRGTIGIFPVFCMIMLSIGLMNHVLVIPPLLEVALRDAWISILIVIIPYLIWVSILYYMMKRSRQRPFLTWIREQYGLGIAWFLRICLLIYSLIMATLTLKETVTWTHVSYLPRTPTFLLALTLCVLCLFAAYFGMKAIAISAGVLLPFVIFLGDFVMSANLPAKNYDLLFPILENGWPPILQGLIYIGGGLVELVIILFIQHHLKSELKLWNLWLFALFLILLMFGPVTGAIAEFGPFEAARLRYTAYEEWRLVSIGKYIHHMDFFSIYQWLSGAFIRIAVAICIMLEVLQFKHKRNRIFAVSLIGMLIILFVQIPISDMKFLSFWKHVYFPFSLIFILSFTAFLFVLTFAKTFKRRKTR